MHEGGEALVGICMPCRGEVEVDHRGGALWGPQVARDETGMHAGCEPRRGVGRPEGMEGHACCEEPGTLFGCAEGALDTGATPGIGSRRALCLIAPRGGKEPGLVPVGFPGGS